MLPWVMVEIEEEEEKRRATVRDNTPGGARMRIGEVIVFIRELITPLCARMALAAGTRHQIEQALETLWRLLEPPTDRRAQFRMASLHPTRAPSAGGRGGGGAAEEEAAAVNQN